MKKLLAKSTYLNVINIQKKRPGTHMNDNDNIPHVLSVSKHRYSYIVSETVVALLFAGS